MACGAARRVRARGLALHEWGRPGAPPALLLHSQAAHSHWWDWTAPLLAGTHQVAALDLRGHGASRWPDPPAYRFVDHVADVIAALDHLHWPAPLVVGHSMGGYVAALLAARHPARVGALVIADTLPEWTGQEARWARRALERPGPEFPSRAEAGRRFRLSPPETTAPAGWVRHLGEAGVVERRPGAWAPAFDRRLFGHPHPDAWPFLPDVRCPTLVVRGEGSPVVDRPTCERVAAAVRQGRAVELKGAFHHLILDDPPGFVRLLTDWLATLGPEASPLPRQGQGAG